MTTEEKKAPVTAEDKKAPGTTEDKKGDNNYLNFLETCLGGSVKDTDAHDAKVLGVKDIFEIEEPKEEKAKEKKPAECFALDDSDNDGSSFGDDDDDDEEWDLEDAYNFDPEKVAELLKKSGPIDEEEVIETIQESLADAMLLRMNLENPEEEAARPDCSGQLDGRMTPPAKGPDFEAATPPDPKVLAEKLENQNRRRSSIGGRQNINDAVRSGAARTRKSIACIASHTTADVEDKARILMAADQTTKRHRMSLCKAAETLDMAGLGDEDPEELKEKLKTISKCVMVARGRHRMIVASAVNKTVIGGDEEDSFKETTQEAKSSKEDSSSSAGPKAKPKFMSKLRACAKEYVPTAKQQSIKEKIEAAVAAAYKRNGPVKAPEESEVKEEWTTAYEDMSCYGYEGYTWDGYGGGYDWNNVYGCNQMGNQMGCNQMGCNQMAYNQMNCNQMAYNQMAYDQSGYNQMGCGQMGCGQMGCGQMGAQGCNQWQQGGQWQGQAAQGWNGNYGYDNTGNYGAAYGNDYNNCYYNNYGQAQNGYGGNWQNAAWGSA